MYVFFRHDVLHGRDYEPEYMQRWHASSCISPSIFASAQRCWLDAVLEQWALKRSRIHHTKKMTSQVQAKVLDLVSCSA